MEMYFIEVVNPTNLKEVLEEYTTFNLQDCRNLVNRLIKEGKQTKVYNDCLELMGIY